MIQDHAQVMYEGHSFLQAVKAEQAARQKGLHTHMCCKNGSGNCLHWVYVWPTEERFLMDQRANRMQELSASIALETAELEALRRGEVMDW